MAKKEANFDLYIHDLLVEAGIQADTQGSNIIEINNALKSASKHKTGNVGFPEYCAVVNDFVLVMEDKSDRANLCAFEDDGTTISLTVQATKNYAVYNVPITVDTRISVVPVLRTPTQDVPLFLITVPM